MLVPHSSSADAPQPMEVALVEPTSTVENQPIEKPISNEFTWEIENFYGLSAEEHYSDIFNVGGYKWRMVIGLNCPGHLSLYLDVADSVNLPYGWCISAHFFLTVIDQYDAGNSYTYESEAHHHFSAKASCWGFDKFMHLTQLLDPDRKYIVDDKVKVGAVVTVKAVNDSKKETGYVGLKAQSDTHYMNSLFQTFYHIPFFRKVVYDIPTTKNDMLSESTPLALQSLFCKMQYSENSVVVKELRKFFEFRQYDVLEFSRFLCEKLEDKMKGTIVEDKIQKLFVGRQKNFTKFVNAECQLEKEESFYGLRLDVRGCRDVYDSFEKYVKVESLEGDRNYNDAQLGQQDTRKCVQFISFPPVLQLQLKRFEYDKYGFCTRKINDHYEYPLQLDLDRYIGKKLLPEADQSVRNLYTLHSVLVHGTRGNDGPYYAVIRPTLSDQWFKFHDERVTKEEMKLALEEQYGVEEMISHGFSNTFYDLMKYTNAYMLVYIRESEKENLFFEVVKGDIAEHLIEGYFSWNKELKEKERKKREKAEGHLYTSIKVARDEDLVEQIGRRGFYFDLVDHDKVRSYRVKKQMHFILFKEMVVEEFCIQVQNLRFWLWDKRQNNTYRPSRPLTCQEEQQTVGQLSEVSNETHSAGLKLFLEMELGPDMLPLPLPPPDKTKDNILLFFKLYDFEIGKLRYVGRLFVKGIDKPVDILPKLNEMAGFDPSEEIELYEEIEFQPSVKCEHIDKKLTFRSRQMEDGGIICFQKSKSGGTRNRKYLDVPSFLEYVHDLLVIRFRKLEEPNEDDFILELPKLSTYEDIVKIVDDQLNLNDTSRIRLTSHDGFYQSPYFEPIVYWQMEHLSDMLVDGHQAVDILYYEVLPQLEGLQTETIVSHSGVTDENFAIPEEVEYIYNCCPLPLQNEENPEEGKNLGHQIRLIHIFHFTRDTSQNQMFFEYFGVPFSLIIHEGETLAKIKERIQMNWQFPEEKFVKWNFAFIPSAGPIFRRVLKDNDIVSSHFQMTDTHGPWMQHLGLEHSYRTPNRDYDADTMVWKCPRPKGNPYGDEFGTNFCQQLSFSLSLSISIFSLASLFSYLF